MLKDLPAAVEAIERRLHDPDPEVRRVAVLELPYSDAYDGEEAFVPLLVDALADAAPAVRLAAAQALEGFETAEVLAPLVRLLEDPDLEVRAGAGAVLAELKQPSSARFVRPYLDHAEASVRTAALRAMRPLRVDEAFQPALAAIGDADAAVRREAVGVLGYLRRPEAVGRLAALAAGDDDAEVRRAAVGALAYSSEVSVLPSLTRALADPSWQVREESAQTIGKLRLRAGVPNLVAALDDPFWQVRVKAARSLGRLKAAEALDALAASLGHDVSNLRKEAAIALGEIGDVRAVRPLERALADADPDVRKLARLALAAIQLAGGQAEARA